MLFFKRLDVTVKLKRQSIEMVLFIAMGDGLGWGEGVLASDKGFYCH